MKRSKQWLCGVLSAMAVILLILDSKTAIEGAKDGVRLCIETLIPSLFPFLVFTGMVTSAFVGKKIRILGPIARSLGIPEGGESLLILGILGGYPVGAQAVYDAYQSGQIEANTAKRLLGFCSNAGPAFIFGIVANLYAKPMMAWIIWGIHILSALLTGRILPGKSDRKCNLKSSPYLSFPHAMNNGVKNMAAICGWVIIFRILASYLNRWILWRLPAEISVSILGTLELTNGCIALKGIHSETVKFIISSWLLSFGGLCVWMQTISVTKDLGTGMYLPGKLMQSFFSLLLAGSIQLFSNSVAAEVCKLSIIIMIVFCMLVFTMIKIHKTKKVVALCK